MLPGDLLSTAKKLVDSGKKKPKQADLRRAVSTTYYALFHTLARCCADLLVGSSKSKRSNEAWHQVYRALEHGLAKSACNKKGIMEKFPAAIQDFAIRFIEMQEKRHKADYDPTEKFFKSEVEVDIKFTESVIKKFNAVHIKDRRAFAVFALLKPPRQ